MWALRQIEDIPESLCDLASLEVLRLGGNRLSTLPQAIGDLGKLRELSLRPSPTLRSLPWRLCHLSATLEKFDLGAWPEDLTIIYVRAAWTEQWRRGWRAVSENQLSLPRCVGAGAAGRPAARTHAEHADGVYRHRGTPAAGTTRAGVPAAHGLARHGADSRGRTGPVLAVGGPRHGGWRRECG